MGRLPPMPLLICWFGLVSFWNYSSYQSNVLSIRIPDGFFLWLFWMFFLFCFVCLFLFDMVKQVGAGVWGWWGRRGWTLRVKSSRVKWGDGSVTSQPACHGGKQTGGRLRRSSQGYSFATWCPLVSQMTDLDPPVFLISGSQLSRMADQVLMKSLRRLFFFFCKPKSVHVRFLFFSFFFSFSFSSSSPFFFFRFPGFFSCLHFHGQSIYLRPVERKRRRLFHPLLIPESICVPWMKLSAHHHHIYIIIYFITHTYHHIFHIHIIIYIFHHHIFIYSSRIKWNGMAMRRGKVSWMFRAASCVYR